MNITNNKGVSTDYVKIAVSQCSVGADCTADANPCTDDICSSGICTHPNNTASCSDGNPCTVGDVCGGGTCHSGSAVDCSGPSDQCNIASCDPAGPEGNCIIRTPVANGT
ncbi:MAG: hypothetical protein ACREJ6_04350, partial [Candidatus Methylomirabilis sp.]